MKLVILEPLGVEKEKLLAMAEKAAAGRIEIVSYDTAPRTCPRSSSAAGTRTRSCSPTCPIRAR